MEILQKYEDKDRFQNVMSVCRGHCLTDSASQYAAPPRLTDAVNLDHVTRSAGPYNVLSMIFPARRISSLTVQ